MKPSCADPAAYALPRDPGFTLLELLLVMALLGIILGMGSLGLERMDPGARGFQETLSVFLESGRDRARATGFPVSVEIEGPAEAGGFGRVVRYAFRPVLEANFETRFAREQGVTLVGGARLGRPGRLGGGLDLGAGGGAVVAGRGGRVRASFGLAVDLELRPRALVSAGLLDWEDLLVIRLRRDGRLEAELGIEEEAGTGRVRLETPPGALLPGRWQHLRLLAADGQVALLVDGGLAAEAGFEGRLREPAAPLFLGDRQDRFQGGVDELQVRARLREAGPRFREGVAAVFGAARVVFDRYGLLDRKEHPEAVTVEILETGTVAGGFVVGRFAQEEAAP